VLTLHFTRRKRKTKEDIQSSRCLETELNRRLAECKSIASPFSDPVLKMEDEREKLKIFRIRFSVALGIKSIKV
jgi:hypothetical protein